MCRWRCRHPLDRGPGSRGPFIQDLKGRLLHLCQAAQMLDELLELRPFTFISEIRYRELKQRWGQVFRADMGAEAFYDILERLD